MSKVFFLYILFIYRKKNLMETQFQEKFS